MKPLAAWLELLDRPGGAARLLDPPETAPRRGPILRRALALAAARLGPRAEALVIRAPGRVNLMGMHIDHRGGAINPVAVQDVFFAAAPRPDGRFRIANAEEAFPPREFSLAEISPPGGTADWDSWTHAEHEQRQGAGLAADWSNYIKAPLAWLRFSAPDRPLRGMDLFVAGGLPKAAGLSSSSALVVGAALAAAALNGLGLDPWPLVEICGRGEWYVGTRGGHGDHAAILFGRRDCVAHLGSAPLTVEHVPLPAGWALILANSLVEARKTAGARDVFNQRVAAYEIGFRLLQARDPRVRERARLLRDVNPETLGCSEAEICRGLKILPEEASREEIRRRWPAGAAADLERFFRSHADIGPYLLRGVVAYGVAECQRSRLAREALRRGDARLFGELINLSHEGDRVSREGRPWRPDLSDAALDALAAERESGDPGRAARAALWRLPGRYAVSCPELDLLADLARAVPGVAGAGRVGAGLGGAVVVLAAREAAGAVLAKLRDGYYAPRGLPFSAEEIRPLDGAGVIPFPD